MVLKGVQVFEKRSSFHRNSYTSGFVQSNLLSYGLFFTNKNAIQFIVVGLVQLLTNYSSLEYTKVSRYLHIRHNWSKKMHTSFCDQLSYSCINHAHGCINIAYAFTDSDTMTQGSDLL